jgi:hypothetical protein
MSGVGVLGLLWAVAGIVLGLLWWRERLVDGPAAIAAVERRTTERVHFGSLREDRGPRRLQAMRRSYALGAWLVALGLVADQALPLAAGALALNLGTLFHHLALGDQALAESGLRTGLERA